MTIRKYSSRSQQTNLSAALTSSALEANVVSVPILLGGLTVSPGETFTAVIDPDTALEEIIDVTATLNNTLTISRGVDTATPGVGQAHSAGAVVRHMAIGRDYRESNLHIESGLGSTVSTSAHGVNFNTVVKTSDTGTVQNGMIAANAVTTAKIANASITTDKLADGSVTSVKIADFNIANADILDSAISTAKIADSAITSAKIADLTIVTGDIADSAITSAKIADGTIVAGDLADGAVTSGKILDGAIVNADINIAAAIDKTKISGTAVTVADIGTVTSTMIADATIVNADISATAAIARTKLDIGGTITSADLVDGTIVAADIANATLTAAKFVTDPYARANHTGTQLAATVSDFDTQVRTSRLDQMTVPTATVSFNSQRVASVADPVSTQDAVTLNYLNNQKGALNGIASLDGAGKIPTGQLPAIAVTDTFVVSSEAAMLALTADVGDIAIRSDLNKSFILRATPATTLSNWNELLTPTDIVLSVDGNTGVVNLSGLYVNHAGDTMTGDLILNADPTVALGAATKQYVDVIGGSAAAAAASAAAAATTYDNFDDRYLGAKATPPTFDNDGNALITGALYWNSVSNAMFAWSGSAWTSISSTAAIFRFRFTAAGGETSESGVDDFGLTLSYLVGKEQVYLNGILLSRTSDYNATDGTSITGLAALAAGDILEIITFTAFEVATAIPNTSFIAKGTILVGTAAGTYAAQAVGTDGQYLTANSAQADGVEWTTIDTSAINNNYILALMGAI